MIYSIGCHKTNGHLQTHKHQLGLNKRGTELLERKANWLQLKDEERLDLGTWLQELIQTPLSLDTKHLGFETSPLVLGQLTQEHMWSEMEFNLEAHHVPAKLIDQHIQSHLFVGEARPALQPRLMQGMLTGSLDLVLQHNQRYWVVDYKSNKLNDYAAGTLQEAVLHKRYEVQYVLYTLCPTPPPEGSPAQL